MFDFQLKKLSFTDCFLLLSHAHFSAPRN